MACTWICSDSMVLKLSLVQYIQARRGVAVGYEGESLILDWVFRGERVVGGVPVLSTWCWFAICALNNANVVSEGRKTFCSTNVDFVTQCGAVKHSLNLLWFLFAIIFYTICRRAVVNMLPCVLICTIWQWCQSR